MTTRITTYSLMLLMGMTLVGCNGAVTSSPPTTTAPVANPDGAVVPPRATPDSGTQVDVNPPGGGIHVSTPPDQGGNGVNVDVGGGNGVRVTPNR